MSVDPAGVALGVLVLIGSSAAAWYLKRRLDASTGIDSAGWAMTLMIANVLQLVGIVVVLASVFE
ncbi:MAG TPA: hypothetical protein VLA91_12610 [Acidimicrobiia bacterium]|nr:hypothetical protein [Acidimicrobiia bacterium]